jgi:FKBP-type peptidyl-prolyl cis-trans isomerase 2
MTIRCKSFATTNEPGGLKYYSTKDDAKFNELAWIIGSGEASPALELGMMGMHKNALRRIEIPSTAAYAARKANQLPLATTKEGKRLYDNLFKNDATLLFEVLVTRIK